jgi:hypothetical protein
MNMDVEKKFIKSLSETHGVKIIEFFEKEGVENPKGWCGDAVGLCYGVINGRLTFIKQSDVYEIGGEIIELPEENGYPKVMMVSDFPITKGNKGQQRVVFMEKMGKYLAWANVETIEDAEKEMMITTWNYAVDVPKENPQKTEMLKRVEELKSNIAKMQKQVDEIQAEAEKI